MLSMLTLTSGLLYAWATLIADEHAPAWLFGGGHTDSSFWFCWLRLVLGFGLWSSALLTRLQAMNKLYLHNEEPLWFLIKLIQVTPRLVCRRLAYVQLPRFANLPPPPQPPQNLPQHPPRSPPAMGSCSLCAELCGALQYLTPWLVVAMMVTLTADPPISLFSGTLVRAPRAQASSRAAQDKTHRSVSCDCRIAVKVTRCKGDARLSICNEPCVIHRRGRERFVSDRPPPPANPRGEKGSSGAWPVPQNIDRRP